MSVTTDQLATRALERNNVPVQWLACSGQVEGTGKKDKGSPPPVTAVGVDCQGQTKDGKKIIVYGRVTGISGDSCVRGNLTAKVGGKTVFTATVLGSCDGDGDSDGESPGPSSGGGHTDAPAPHQPTQSPQPWPSASDTCSPKQSESDRPGPGATLPGK
ncbi:hypothetical protein [Streptomyces varsoviensis]|uniref:hypothetical protein n=1 Tax=Streptomyces varsoviensis TaxID=67373 RepID=UPI00068DBBAC|nr:hypothetical protein [Streptomyces varsoviensis]